MSRLPLGKGLMQELRAKISLDNVGFLAQVAAAEQAVAKLSRSGLASGFVKSFEQLRSKGMFAGLLDGLVSVKLATDGLTKSRQRYSETRVRYDKDIAELKALKAIAGSPLKIMPDAAAQLAPFTKAVSDAKKEYAKFADPGLLAKGTVGKLAAAKTAMEAAAAGIRNQSKVARTALVEAVTSVRGKVGVGVILPEKAVATLEPFVKAVQKAKAEYLSFEAAATRTKTTKTIADAETAKFKALKAQIEATKKARMGGVWVGPGPDPMATLTAGLAAQRTRMASAVASAKMAKEQFASIGGGAGWVAKLAALRIGFDLSKSALASQAQGLRGKTGTQMITTEQAKEKLGPFIEAVRKADAEVKKLDAGTALAPLKKGVAEATKGVEALKTALEKAAAARTKLEAAKGNLAQAAHALRADKLKEVSDRATSTKAVMTAAFRDVGSAVMNVAAAWGVTFFAVFRVVGSALLGIVRTIVSAVGVALEAIKSMIGHIIKGIGTMAGVLGGVVATLGVIAAIGVKKAVDVGRDLVNMQAQTGIKPPQGLILRTGAEMAGFQAEKFTTEITRLQTAISDVGPIADKTRQAMQALGIDIYKLREKSPVEQLEMVGEKLRGLKTAADRSAAATKIFTIRGAEMLSLLNQPGLFDLAKQQWGSAVGIFDKMAAKFAFVSRAITGLFQVKPTAFFAGIAAGMERSLTFFADKINRFDVAVFGKRIADALETAVTIFYRSLQVDAETGVRPIWELLQLGLSAAVRAAGNELIAAMKAAVTFTTELFKVSGLFKAIGDGISGAFKVGVAAFLEAFQGILPDMAEGIGKIFGKAHLEAAKVMHPLDYQTFLIEQSEAANTAGEMVALRRKELAELSTPEGAEQFRRRPVGQPGSGDVERRKKFLAADIVRYQKIGEAYADAAKTGEGFRGMETGGKALRDWMEKQIAEAPENIKEGSDQIAAAFDSVIDKTPEMVAAIAKAREEFEKAKDAFGATEAFLKLKELADALNIQLPPTKVPPLPAPGTENTPFERIYRRVFEAPSGLEKVGASFNRDRRYGLLAGRQLGFGTFGESERPPTQRNFDIAISQRQLEKFRATQEEFIAPEKLEKFGMRTLQDILARIPAQPRLPMELPKTEPEGFEPPLTLEKPTAEPEQQTTFQAAFDEQLAALNKIVTNTGKLIAIDEAQAEPLKAPGISGPDYRAIGETYRPIGYRAMGEPDPRIRMMGQPSRETGYRPLGGDTAGDAMRKAMMDAVANVRGGIEAGVAAKQEALSAGVATTSARARGIIPPAGTPATFAFGGGAAMLAARRDPAALMGRVAANTGKTAASTGKTADILARIEAKFGPPPEPEEGHSPAVISYNSFR